MVSNPLSGGDQLEDIGESAYVDPNDFEVPESPVFNPACPKNAELFQACFLNAPIALMLVDVDTRRIYEWNPYATSLFGFQRDQAIGETIGLIIDPSTMSESEHDDFFDRYAARGIDAMARTFDRGRTIRGRTKDGRKPFIRVKVFPAVGPDGKQYIGAALEDLSQTNQLLREVESSNKELEAKRHELESLYQSQLDSNSKLFNDNVDLNDALIKAEQARARADFRIQQFRGRATIIKALLGVIVVGLFFPMLISGFNRVPSEILQLNRDLLIILASLLSALGSGFFGLQEGLRESANVSQTTYTGGMYSQPAVPGREVISPAPGADPYEEMTVRPDYSTTPPVSTHTRRERIDTRETINDGP